MTDLTPSIPPTLEENREPCPTPLAWQEVVQEFQKEIRQGPVSFAGGHVTATQFGTGRPLIFLPGSLSSSRLYALTAWLLKDQRECWLLDHPQFDHAPAPSKLIPQTAGAYSSVLQALCGGPVDVYASNYGVPVCLEMMLQTPQSIERALLQSGWASKQLTVTEKLLLHIGKHLSLSVKRIPLWLSTQIQNHRPWFPPFDETRFGFLLNETYQTSVRDVSKRLLAAASTDFTERLPEIGHQILVVRCEGDGHRIAEEEDRLETLLPNCKSTWMHSTGHYPYLTHPHRLLKVMREFFEIEQPTPQSPPVSLSQET